MTRALVIVHEPNCTAGGIETRLRERRLEVETHLVVPDPEQPNDAAPWPSFDDYDLVLPMGTFRSLTRKYEISTWIHHELDLVRAAHEADQPMLGICFGGQLLSEALGGEVEETPEPEIGWLSLSAADGAELPVPDGPWQIWHHDRFTTPPGAQCLAVTGHAVQLFRHGRTVGAQFHPEVDAEMIARWIDALDDSYFDRHELSRAEMLTQARHHEAENLERCRALVDWFLDDVVAGDQSSPRARR